MSTQVTVNLPDDLYRRAEHLARLTGRNVSDVLVETLEASLSLLAAGPPPPDVSQLSNVELLALADVQMNAEQGNRLSELLDRQRAGSITSSERFELLALMQVYDEILGRKAAALAEAARRGLRPMAG